VSDRSDLSDDELEVALRRALAGTAAVNEEVPASVVSASMWAHEFHNMEAELVQAAEATAAELGARSLQTRTLLFGFEDVDVELEITPQRNGGTRIDGVVAPTEAGVVRGTVGGAVVTTEISASGNFSIDAAAESGTALLAIALENSLLRLGAFAI